VREGNDDKDYGHMFLTFYFDKTKHNKYTTTMLRRRITASYADSKTTPRANLVRRIQKRFPEGTFEDQEYFHVHQPYVGRAVGQSVRCWFEEISEFNEMLETVDEFFQERLIEGSDLIKLQDNYEVMRGADNPRSENGYVILSHYTSNSKKSELKKQIEDIGFTDKSKQNKLEPREYGFLRYPDVENPVGLVLKYWYEGMGERDIRRALSSIVKEMRPQSKEVGKIIFTENVRVT